MGVEIMRVAGWDEYSWLRHGFSTRVGGVSTVYCGHDLNLGFTKEDARADVATNRARFVAEVFAGARLVTVRQVHGVGVRGVDETGDADGLVTNLAGVGLGILTADCVPVLVVDTRLRVVAALHAGWRGTAARMVGAGVARMQEEYGSRVEDMVAAVGPSIGACCYEVGEEFVGRFGEEVLGRRDGKLRLDLWEATRRQLVEAGVGAVTVMGECTACARVGAGGRKYFSHRAELGVTGRMMAVVGVAGE